MTDWLFYQQHHFANACSQGKISLSFTTGMEFPNGMKLSFCSGKDVSVYVD